MNISKLEAELIINLITAHLEEGKERDLALFELLQRIAYEFPDYENLCDAYISEEQGNRKISDENIDMLILQTIIKHYICDIGLFVMFENMTDNFIVGKSFKEIYEKFLNTVILLEVTKQCVEERGLPSNMIFGILKEVNDEVIKITLFETKKFGIESIYLYENDIV